MDNEIKLSETSVQILEAKNLTKDHTLVVTVDLGNMPGHIVNGIFEKYKDAFKKIFPEVQIVVIPKNIQIEVVSTVDLVE